MDINYYKYYMIKEFVSPGHFYSVIPNITKNDWLFDLSSGITSFPTGSATGSAN